MKKVFLTVMVAVMSVVGLSAQDSGFSGGIHIGIPTGDLKDTSSFNAGLDISYMYSVSDVFTVGATTGYTNFFGKEYKYSAGGTSVTVKATDYAFIPLAATAEYTVSDKIYLGLDLGYAFSADKDVDGGLYYQPKVGYNVSELINVYLGYKGIDLDGSAATTISLGAAYKF